MSVGLASHHEAQAKAMTEAELLSTVLAIAKRHGWLAYHTHDSRRSQAGYPDLTLVHATRGRLLFRELKSQRGRLRPEQLTWLEAIYAVGQDVGVWRPMDLLNGTVHRTLLEGSA